MLLGSKLFNVGHICASPQTIVLDRSWKLASEFSEEIHRQLSSIVSDVKPYYVGTQDRLDSLRKTASNSKHYPNVGVIFVPDVDAPGGGGDYTLRTEFFAPALGIKYIDSNNNTSDYLKKASAIVNEKCFGSLSCTVVIHPSTRKTLGSKFDEFIYDLNWGTIGINIWAGFMAINPYGTWGAPVNRHVDTDIQSGTGKMGNALLIKNSNKSIMDGDWGDPILVRLMDTPNKAGTKRARAFTNLAVQQSIGALVNLLVAIFT